jgi:hypothetical protein
MAFASTARADGQAVAESTYEKAKAFADAGNYAAACPLFDASFRADPALGTLLNLADCNEHLGKTATAWARFREGKTVAVTLFAEPPPVATARQSTAVSLDVPPPRRAGMSGLRAPITGATITAAPAPGGSCLDPGDSGVTALFDVTPGSVTVMGSGSGTFRSHPLEVLADTLTMTQLIEE